MNVEERKSEWQNLLGKSLIENISESILEYTGINDFESKEYQTKVKSIFDEHFYPYAEHELWIQEQKDEEKSFRFYLNEHIEQMRKRGFSDYHCLSEIFGVLGFLSEIGVRKPEVVMFCSCIKLPHGELLQQEKLKKYVRIHGKKCVSEILNKLAEIPRQRWVDLDVVFCDEFKNPYDAICDETGYDDLFPINYQG